MQQARAANPAVNAWVAASAGSGKTQVLAARILRLLVGGVAPERILALTFTRAAASEMQARVLGVLTRWARAGPDCIAADLDAIGMPDAGADDLARAGGLLELSLDARGGLQVRTIHGFASSLVAAFPFEAGMPPGVGILDERGESRLQADALVSVARDPAALRDLEAMALRRGEAGARAALDVMVRYGDAVVRTGDLFEFEERLRLLLDCTGEGTPEDVLAAALEDDAIDWSAIRRFGQACASATGSKLQRTGLLLTNWIDRAARARADHLHELFEAVLTKDGDPLKHGSWGIGGLTAAQPDAAELADAVQAIAGHLLGLKRRLEIAHVAACHLRAGRRFAVALNACKALEGGAAFDDILHAAARLLSEPSGAQWVRRKLDQRFDHILVDEAQDSNAAQWSIVEALAGEHGAGEGEAQASRSIFAVGDLKQSIFGFQGAAPAEFLAARDRFAARGVAIESIDLAINFRSAPAVLRAVDRLVAHATPAALGLGEAPPAHVPHRRAARGQVTLWAPVSADAEEAPDDSDGGGEGIEDEALAGDAGDDRDATATSAERAFARRLAMTVRGWLSDPGANSARGGPVRPEHVLVLVRRRQPALIAALVSALQQAGVPVAGPDRLLLTADLAVRDMLSLARFAVQPGDDLALCEVLTSPMGGLGHDQLTALAHGRGLRDTVWQRLRESTDPVHRDIANWLRGLLASVDYDPPAQWLRKVLDHPQRGSRAITARLGGQALDSLGELLNAAHDHAREHVPVMRDFLRWLLAHEAAIKRDPDAPRGEVRIMTVHAAKGLQAPIVILADATARPRGERDAWLPHDLGSGPVPIFHGGKARLVGPLEQAAAIRAQRTAQEELRLLYVAMTRAEDQLFVGGALSARDRGAAHAQCWWSILRDSLADELQQQDAMGWPGQSLVLADPPGPVAAAGQSATLPPAEPAPAWLFTTPAPPEPHARPLRPSRLLPLPPGDAPAVLGARAETAMRGRLLHLLFERIGGVGAADRAARARQLLTAFAPRMAESERAALVDEVLAAILIPDVEPLFGPDALAEVALAGVVAGTVIEGRIDRLLVEPGRVRLLEFKTSARVPHALDAVHAGHLAQIAAYWAVACNVWPDHRIDAGLLFTAAPRFFPVPQEMLASHAPGGDCSRTAGPSSAVAR